MKHLVKRTLWIAALLLSLLFGLCACDQTEPGSSTHSDFPAGSTPSVNVEVPSSSNEPPEGCDRHSYSDGIWICTVCGYDYYSDSLEFTRSQTGDAYIVSSVGTCTARKIIIPAVYSGLPVVEIGESAFNHEKKLPEEMDRITEIVLPASIQKIGSDAFRCCRALQKIVIPEGIAEIEDATFLDCWALENITLPGSLTKIGRSAFGMCGSLVSIEIPEGVTIIGGSAFSACTSLKEIKLPDGITSFG